MPNICGKGDYLMWASRNGIHDHTISYFRGLTWSRTKSLFVQINFCNMKWIWVRMLVRPGGEWKVMSSQNPFWTQVCKMCVNVIKNIVSWNKLEKAQVQGSENYLSTMFVSQDFNADVSCAVTLTRHFWDIPQGSQFCGTPIYKILC